MKPPVCSELHSSYSRLTLAAIMEGKHFVRFLAVRCQ